MRRAGLRTGGALSVSMRGFDMCGGSSGNTKPPAPEPATTFQTIRRGDPSQRNRVWQGTPGNVAPENRVNYSTFGSELAEGGS